MVDGDDGGKAKKVMKTKLKEKLNGLYKDKSNNICAKIVLWRRGRKRSQILGVRRALNEMAGTCD